MNLEGDRKIFNKLFSSQIQFRIGIDYSKLL